MQAEQNNGMNPTAKFAKSLEMSLKLPRIQTELQITVAKDAHQFNDIADLKAF